VAAITAHKFTRLFVSGSESVNAILYSLHHSLAHMCRIVWRQCSKRHFILDKNYS